MSLSTETTKRRGIVLAIVASALGFFVDLYDIIIASVVRRPSLLAVGVAEADLQSKGVLLLNVQMAGMLVGGFLWGIIGDKRGRLSVLFGSIFLYSTATFLHAYVQNYEMYLLLRFLAGVGLAGELGAAVTLVSEQMNPKWRGMGPAIIGSFGMLGAVAGAYVGGHYSWQFTYQLGGAMGIILLLLRLGVLESGLYEQLKTQKHVRQGDLWLVLKDRRNALKYFSIILMGFPGWFVNGVVMTFTPEIAAAMGMKTLPAVSTVFSVFFIGFTLGDFSCGLVSQLLKSRKKAILIYISSFAIFLATYFVMARQSVTAYYVLFFLLGISVGYTIVLITNGAEMFGTNVRALVTTSSLNLLRASVIPQATLFNVLTPSLGAAQSAMVVGVLSLAIAFWAYTKLEETFDKDMNFVEE
jgi:MFS transporter, putative metabolite:H+ symporter